VAKIKQVLINEDVKLSDDEELELSNLIIEGLEDKVTDLENHFLLYQQVMNAKFNESLINRYGENKAFELTNKLINILNEEINSTPL
jgi:hypothetical protein